MSGDDPTQLAEVHLSSALAHLAEARQSDLVDEDLDARLEQAYEDVGLTLAEVAQLRVARDGTEVVEDS